MADPNVTLDHTCDAELLAAAGRGDERAAADLFARYYNRLRQLVDARRGWRLRQAESADDVLQSVFRTVFKRGEAGQIDLSGEQDLWPLLATIAMRKIYNHAAFWGRERRDPAREVDADLSKRLEQGPSPDHAAMTSELIDQLIEAFPERRRRVVAMLLEGQDVATISAAVDLSQRAVYHTRAAVAQTLRSAITEAE